MRWTFLAVGLLVIGTPAAAQVRVADFGFSAGVASGADAAAAAQITAGATLRLGARHYELAAGSSAEDAFLSAMALGRAARFTYGGGVALHSVAGEFRPALTSLAAYAVPLAPLSAAALQLQTRGALLRGGMRLSLALAIVLAPARGGMMLGENVRLSIAPTEIGRTWESIITQIMLLDNGQSSLDDVMVTPTAIVMRFSQGRQEALFTDVGRVARILSASSEPLYLSVTGPQPIGVAAAATAGGFPAERIMATDTTAEITLRATRTASAAAIRSAR